MEVEVRPEHLGIIQGTGRAFVVLGSPDTEKKLLITCGPGTFEAIKIKLFNIPAAEQEAHDFLVAVMEKLGAKMEKVVIVSYDPQRNFFNSVTHLLDGNGKTFTIDFGPTDPIALAMRTGSKIYIENELLEQMGQLLPPPWRGPNRGEVDDQDINEMYDWGSIPKE